MRTTVIALNCLVALCLAASPHAQEKGDGAETIRKVGHLVIVSTNEGKVDSATLICKEKDGWEDEVHYLLVLNRRTRELALKFKGRNVLVTGTLKMEEDYALDQIVVASIVPTAGKLGAPPKPGVGDKDDELF